VRGRHALVRGRTRAGAKETCGCERGSVLVPRRHLLVRGSARNGAAVKTLFVRGARGLVRGRRFLLRACGAVATVPGAGNVAIIRTRTGPGVDRRRSHRGSIPRDGACVNHVARVRNTHSTAQLTPSRMRAPDPQLRSVLIVAHASGSGVGNTRTAELTRLRLRASDPQPRSVAIIPHAGGIGKGSRPTNITSQQHHKGMHPA